MSKVLRKEFKLAASPLSFWFILFGFMFFIPGYPILCGTFFVTLGIYQTFQNTKENNDIIFSVLLPIAKRDVVVGKYIFACVIEMCSFALMTIAVIFRMTLFVDAPAYVNNALMNANFFALGMAAIIFGAFNAIFVGGFFKRIYKFGRSFLFSLIITFILVGIAETLHHIPGLNVLNAFGTSNIGIQVALMILGIVVFALVTYISFRISCKRFEKLDL